MDEINKPQPKIDQTPEPAPEPAQLEIYPEVTIEPPTIEPNYLAEPPVAGLNQPPPEPVYQLEPSVVDLVPPPQAPPDSSKPRRRLFGSLITMLVVALLAAILYDFRTVLPIIKIGDEPAIQYESTTYAMRDRPGFTELEELILSTNQKYLNQYNSGDIWKYLTPTANNQSYVRQFLDLLGNYVSELEGFYGRQSNNPSELDFKIEYTAFELRQLERSFLAGEALDSTIAITREDGSVAIVDKAQTPTNLYEAEAWAKNFSGWLGADGTYKDSATELAKKFDMYLDYNLENAFIKCLGENDLKIIAAYCHATPEKIYINKNSQSYDQIVRHPYFIGAIKHEISHHQIALTCLTTAPPIVGNKIEAVTNSYANLFLGANLVNEYYEAYPEYQVSAATDDIARQIHDEGRCN